jgi:hypothetical protein
MAKTVKQCIIRWCIDYSYLSGIGQFHPTLTKCPDGYRSPRTTGNRSGRWSSISVPGVLFLRFYWFCWHINLHRHSKMLAFSLSIMEPNQTFATRSGYFALTTLSSDEFIFSHKKAKILSNLCSF